MKLAGSAVIGVGRDQVWAALQDPEVLVRTIPGCQRLEETGADTYRMTVSAGVASIKGVYQGEVALSDPSQPERFVLRARGQGAPGTVEATVVVRLSEIDGGTRVDYDADAVVGGVIGGVGQRMLSSVAKRTAGDFFAAVESHLRGAPAAPAQPEPPMARASGAHVFERPQDSAAKGRTRVRPWTMLAAFGMGAGVALGSAVIGWLLGRSTRKA